MSARGRVADGSIEADTNRLSASWREVFNRSRRATMQSERTMTQTTDTNAALLRKLDETARRFDELQSQLNDPAVHSNSARLIAISKESGQIEPVVDKYRAYRKALEAASELRELSNGTDKEMSELATSELPDAESRASAVERHRIRSDRARARNHRARAAGTPPSPSPC
jgi:hypothetical protein